MARHGRLSPSTRHSTSPLVVDASSLPGGESCRFRAVATAEFRAASADSHSFSLPRADRRLAIDVKESHCEPGRVDLTAMIDLRGHEGVAPHEIVWHSDLDGELGRGHMLSVVSRRRPAPDYGKHSRRRQRPGPGDRHHHRGRTRAISWTKQLRLFRQAGRRGESSRVFASEVDILTFGDVWRRDTQSQCLSAAVFHGFSTMIYLQPTCSVDVVPV